MIRFITASAGIYICCMNYLTVCNTISECAISGCNATLEWNLDNVSSKAELIVVNIKNASGNVIAECQYDLCASRDNQSFKCKLSHEKKELNISLYIINVTTNHSGNYTAWMKQGKTFENYTKHLIVKDKAYGNCICYSEDSKHCTVLPYISSSSLPNYKYTFTKKEVNGFPFELLGLGLVFVACSLIIVGILISLTQRRKFVSRRLGSRTVHWSFVEPSNRNVLQELLSFEDNDTPLTVPTTHEHACRRIRTMGHANIHRKSRSLRTLMDHTEDLWNPIRQTLSLQTLIPLSHAIQRRDQLDNSQDKTCSSSRIDRLPSTEGSANEIRLDELYSMVRKDNQFSSVDQHTGAKSLNMNNFLPQSLGQHTQEDQYSTIDEARLSFFHCDKANETDESLDVDRRNAEAGYHDYDYATSPTLYNP